MPINIVTSSFFTKLPPEFRRISIARSKPRSMENLPEIRELAPGSWFRSVDADEYRRRYFAQLAKLNAREIVGRIEDLAAGGPAALLCWERPKERAWCHRAYASQWLHWKLGLEVREFSLEDEGFGEFHPKLPPAHRLAPPQMLLL